MSETQELANEIRNQTVLGLIIDFEETKNAYFKEIYLDGEHWQLVMIAEDGFTARIDLKIGE